MAQQFIGLIGKARSGKDTVATRLVTAHGFRQIAFADPLRDMALGVNPIIGYEPSDFGTLSMRLAYAVRTFGWDGAKAQYPEVRRFLQELGQGVRTNDRDYWVRHAFKRIHTAAQAGRSVVVSDVRYANEAEWLSKVGFTLVRVIRPGAGALGTAAFHSSETEQDGIAHDAVIRNNATIGTLNFRVDGYVRSLS